MEKVVPPFLAVLLACYVVGTTILAATKMLHELRDLAIGVKKIEEGDRLVKLRVRLATLFNSYIPIWRAICHSLVLLSIIMVLSAVYLGGDLPNRQVSILLLCFGSTVSLVSALIYLYAGGQDVLAIQESIKSEMKSALSASNITTVTAESCSMNVSVNRVFISELANLPCCIRENEAHARLARSWQRCWVGLSYATRVFFCGLEFRLDLIANEAGGVTDATPKSLD